jgi:hypothetical protein
VRAGRVRHQARPQPAVGAITAPSYVRPERLTWRPEGAKLFV